MNNLESTSKNSIKLDLDPSIKLFAEKFAERWTNLFVKHSKEVRDEFIKDFISSTPTENVDTEELKQSLEIELPLFNLVLLKCENEIPLNESGCIELKVSFDYDNYKDDAVKVDKNE